MKLTPLTPYWGIPPSRNSRACKQVIAIGLGEKVGRDFSPPPPPGLWVRHTQQLNTSAFFGG